MFCGQTTVQQLLAVTLPKVNMVLLFGDWRPLSGKRRKAACHTLHVKSRISKGLVHLIAHFEGLQGDSRTNYGT